MPEPSSASSTNAPERPTQSRGGEQKPPSWRVEPAPDGRGAPPQKPPPMLPRNRRGTFLGILVALLVVNFVLALATSQPTERTRVPYQPFFLEQVRTGNVQEISSQEQTIEGDLKKPASYTPPGKKAEQVDKFKTQVPAFIDTADLTKTLDNQNVVINASAPDSGRSAFWTLILGFGVSYLGDGMSFVAVAWLALPPGRIPMRPSRARFQHGGMTFASVLDSLGDVSSLAFGALAFAILFLLVEGLDRIPRP